MGLLEKIQLEKLKNGKSLKTKFDAMRDIDLKRGDIKQVLTESEKNDADDLRLTSLAILLRSDQGDSEESFELANWAVSAKPDSRKIVVGSFVKNKQSVLLVNQLARAKRNDAAVLMKDYFEEGGQMDDVVEWLSLVGGILKKGNLPDDNDGWLDDLGDWLSDGLDTLLGAIKNVADAIAAAGRHLFEAISAVAGWAQSKINSFIEAIISAGKSVKDILTEAAKKGLAALGKFIHAIIEAGKAGVEILNWAVDKAADVLKSALQKLEQIYGSFTTLLIEIAKMAAGKLATIVKVLLTLGKTVAEFIIRLDRIAYAVAKLIVEALRAAGKTVREIMLALLDRSRYIARVVLDALRTLGINITSLLREVISWTASQLSIIIGALKDLNVALALILDAVAAFAAQLAVKLMHAVRIIWTQVREILQFIAMKAIGVIKTLLVALLGTGIHIREVLSNILEELRAAFRESLINGLIQIGRSALSLLKEAALISASAAAVLFAILMDVLGSHRGLTTAERIEAEKVFGASINLDMVKLTDASFAADFIMWINGNRPFTTMYVINFKPGTNLTISTLIHELTHIWQAVNSGGVYMLEALHSQFFGDAYKLTDDDVRNANGKLLNLEREQQAVLVQEYWKAEFHAEAIPVSLDLIRPLAKQVYKRSFRINPVLVFNVLQPVIF